LRHKSFVAGGMIALVVIVSFAVLLGLIYNPLQTLNPVAAATAVLVAFLGMVWFRKSGR
jgi:uncharacterized membrane protein